MLIAHACINASLGESCRLYIDLFMKRRQDLNIQRK